MLKRLAAIAFLFFSAAAIAQEPLYSHYKWFKVEDGLPQSYVSGLQQDKDGFLWIGTRDGLARYDGREFKVFHQKNNDSLGLSSNVITALFLDVENLLWIFYINEKVDCFDTRRMQVVNKDSFATVRKTISELRTRKMYRDRSGKFWLTRNSQGVVCYDTHRKTTTWFNIEHKNLASNNVAGVLEDAKGQIYVFTDKGIEKPGVTSSFIPYPDTIHLTFTIDAHRAVITMPDGRLFVSAANELIVFDPIKKIFSSYVLPATVPVKEGVIQHLQAGKDGKLYVVAEGGVYELEKNNQYTWLWQSARDNTFASDARSFLVDRSGVIWFGTNASGMYKINLQSVPFTSKPYTTNFSIDVLSQLPLLSNSLPGVFKKEVAAYGFRYAYGPGKTLWLSHRDNDETREPLTICIVKNNTVSLAAAPPGNQAGIRGLSLSPSGRMIAMDVLGNSWAWDDANSLPSFTPTILSLPKSSIVVDMEADENVVWVSTNKQGLYKIENNTIADHFTNETKKNKWPGNQLTDICNDPADKDILWIGTLGYGLIQLKKKTGAIKVFTTDDGLPNNTVYSIVPDDGGNLWLSTNKGISRFDPRANHFYNFDVRDGLPGNEFNRFHHLRLPDGRIAFGGAEAFTIFDPSTFAEDTFATTVALTKVLINNNPVEFTSDKSGLSAPMNELQRLVLPYNKNFLQFEFAGLQFNQPEKIRYRYMLKGYDKEWIETGNRNLASYTKLPPGHYTLLLNASNTSVTWSPEVKQLAIRIRPPLWATWWAYVIYALLVLLLVRSYWRYRTSRIRMQNEIALEQSKAKQLKELDEIKNRFFSNITHELRTPLTLILTPLEKLKEENKFSPADQRILTTAHNNADQLLRLINQLLDISKMESKQMKVNLTIGELSDFVERCVQQFSMEAKDLSIQLLFSRQDVTGHYLFDEDKWEKIIFNLLSNALKFTGEGGEVHVTLSQATNNDLPVNTIQLNVTDSGKGIAEHEIPKLFDRFYMADDSAQRKYSGTGIGLALVKELTDLMKGTINVRSSSGKGASFTVSIPVDKAIESIPVNEIEQFGEKNETVQPTNEPAESTPLLLVAEDNDELRSFLVRELSVKWRVLEAANGKIAHELILKELPEIVISDYMMPECDGETLCRLIKNDPRVAHISFIMLTAKAAHQSIVTGLQAGADEYITKPFHFNELELRIGNLLTQQQRWHEHLREQVLPEKPLPSLPHVNDLFLQQLYQFLEENLDAPGLDVEKLATAVSMSRRTLSRKLKTILNISPNDLIRRYRLQKAATLLSAGHNVSATAYIVGFETPSYFTHCFKEQYGQTPTEFASSKTA